MLKKTCHTLYSFSRSSKACLPAYCSGKLWALCVVCGPPTANCDVYLVAIFLWLSRRVYLIDENLKKEKRHGHYTPHARVTRTRTRVTSHTRPTSVRHRTPPRSHPRAHATPSTKIGIMYAPKNLGLSLRG